MPYKARSAGPAAAPGAPGTCGSAGAAAHGPAAAGAPEPPVPRSRRAMEPPGTAGAPGAAGRPWEEAKAFYDNLAPKKKPKSVRTPPRCRAGQSFPPRRGISPSGCPRVFRLLRVPLGLSRCPISSRFSRVLLGASSSPGFPLEPSGCPISSRCSGVPLGVFVFFFFSLTPISLQVLGKALGSLQVPLWHLWVVLGFLGSLWIPPVSLGSCRSPGGSLIPLG